MVVIVARGGEEGAAPPGPGARPTATVTAEGTPEGRAEPARDPTPDTRVVEGDGELAIGITEPNPAFVHPDAPVPEPFGRWRDALHRMSPDRYRLVVNWPAVDGDLSAPQGGCMRDVLPCMGYAGLTAQLEALAAAQRGGGWETLVVITGSPERYAVGPSGCERAGTEPRSRALTDRGLQAYRRLIRRVQSAADRAGATLRYWSPWNEPNHPYGLSPQRTSCSSQAPDGVVGPYVRMARAMRSELREGQELVLGELAGLLEVKPSYVSVGEFVRDLPRDLVCAAPVFGQHGYVGGPDPVDQLARALRRFRCPRAHDVWITETGVGRPRRGEERRAPGRDECRDIRRRLRRWYEDPRTTAAFQYTLREDDLFPTGLVTVDLRKSYPTLAEWVAWGRRPSPQAPPPRSTC